MTATPWWLGDGDEQPSGPRPSVDPAAVQETIAGGLALVASFLRLAAPAVDSEDVEPEDVEPEDVEPEDVEPEDVEPEDVEPEDVEPEDVEPAPVEAGPVHVGPHLEGECRSCPVCQGLALLREVRPEVVDGLGDVLDALAATVRSFSSSSSSSPARGSAWD